jgi:multidrug efflux pump subunit AcrA (membrane-fusion protein)
VPPFTIVEEELRLEARRAALKAREAEREAAAARAAAAEAEAAAKAEDLRLLVEEDRARAATEAARRRAEAALDAARLRVERLEIRAPADGVVLRRVASPGSKLMLAMDDPTSSSPVLLYDPARLQVRADVPLADAAGIGVGRAAEIVVEVLPGRTFPGEVVRVVPEADIQKNTLQFKVRLLAGDPAIRPEMLAKVRFRAEAGAAGAPAAGGGATGRIFVPERLLRKTEHGDHVQAFVLDRGRGVALLRDLRLGPGREEGWVEVAAGLSPGDALLDADPGALADGARVRLAEGGR